MMWSFHYHGFNKIMSLTSLIETFLMILGILIMFTEFIKYTI